MHYVGKVDWGFAATPAADTENAHGLARAVLIGREQGAVHTEVAVGALQPQGWIRRHVHSFEESLYVLEGELLLEIGGAAHRLTRGDFAVIPIGVWHQLANCSGAEARWLSMNTPQRHSPDDPTGRKDTFYHGAVDLDGLDASAQRPLFGNPTVRYVGHYDGTPPQLEALRLDDPARGRKPIGMDSALLAYSGISVKMLIDKGLGADLLTMFTVDYEVKGAAQPHDHPFEEAYFFLAGNVQAELDGKAYTLGPGDVVFAGVGSTHAFYNDGPERVRWIETQAPQPPARHSYRWSQTWTRFEESLDR